MEGGWSSAGVPDWVGRRVELQAVRAAVRAVAAGVGGSVLVEGEPGIGKSSLVRVALAGDAAAGCRIRHATADEMTTRFPLQVLTDALCLDRSLEGTAAVWGMVDPTVALTERVLARVDELCATGPTVLVVDDLQWADDASLAAWSRLTAACDQMALLLVATCRPVPRSTAASRLRRTLVTRGATVLELGPLTDDEAAELGGRSAGGTAGPGLRRRIAAASGNPLYVIETVDALARDGRLVLDGGEADVVDTTPADPVSLPGAIGDRLAFLTRDTRDVLRLASLLDGDLSVSDLAALTGRSALELMPALDEALDAHVLVARGTALGFRHGLIRDSLAMSMPVAMRASLHRQAAEALAGAGAPIDRVAAQLMSASVEADAWVAGWLADHVDVLVDRMPTVAADLLTRVLDGAVIDAALRDVLELALVTVAYRRRLPAVVDRVATSVLARGPAPATAAAVTWMLAYAWRMVGRFSEAESLLADTASGAPGAWPARLLALRALVLFEFDVGAARIQAREVLDGAAHLRDGTATGYAAHTLSLLEMRDCRTGRALELVDLALEAVGTDLHLYHLRILLLSNRANWSENAEEAGRSLREAREFCARIGAAEYVRDVLACGFLYHTGRWDDVLDEVTMGLDQHQREQYRGDMLGLIALIAARRGDRDTAIAHLAGLPSDTDRPNALYTVLARSKTAEQDRDLRAAAELIAPAVTAPALAGFRHAWIATAARTALAAGDPDLARAAAAAAASAAAEPGGLRGVAARWCAALLDDDVAVLDDCAAAYRRAGFLPLLAEACGDAALACAVGGDTTGARQRMVEAAALHTELGAEWELRRLDSRLRAAGVRRRATITGPRPTTGWGALTRTEARVAAMVVEGRTNPDIAAALFLSRRTVQCHVSHILAKLGVRSRHEIAAHRERA